MARAIIIFLVVLGVIWGGLLLLRRNANTPLPPEVQARIDKRNREGGGRRDEGDEDRSSW